MAVSLGRSGKCVRSMGHRKGTIGVGGAAMVFPLRFYVPPPGLYQRLSWNDYFEAGVKLNGAIRNHEDISA